MIGQTTESVARYVAEGQFGLWTETGRINDAAREAQRDGIGFGEAIGRMIEREKFPYRETSVLAAGARLGVPVTVHVGIGLDIIHEHPNCDGAATGAASYADFLIFTQSVTRLEGGVFLNIGSAVMGPEVYLKALAMSRNVAHQEGRRIGRFTTAVFDIAELGEQLHTEAAQDRSALLFPPLQDGAGADRGRRRRELLRPAATTPGPSRALYDEIIAEGERMNERLMKTIATCHTERLAELVGRFGRLRIAVVGDFFLDKYLDVDPAIAETSVETGKTAHQVAAVRHSPGAAGTVVANLAALGAGELHAVGFTGDDGESYDLRKDLAALGCSTDRLHVEAGRMTPTYLKPRDCSVCGLSGEHNRYDTKNRTPTGRETQQRIVTRAG